MTLTLANLADSLGEMRLEDVNRNIRLMKGSSPKEDSDGSRSFKLKITTMMTTMTTKGYRNKPVAAGAILSVFEVYQGKKCLILKMNVDSVHLPTEAMYVEMPLTLLTGTAESKDVENILRCLFGDINRAEVIPSEILYDESRFGLFS